MIKLFRNFCACTVLIPSMALGELPQRKPGLWEITVSAEGAPSSVMKQCTDKITDMKLMGMGQNMANQAGVNCTKTEVKQEGKAYVGNSECTTAGTKIITKAIYSGDFNSEYITETTVKYDPPLYGMSEGSSKVVARWLGECEAGQKPGDMIMPGGVKTNIEDMSKLAQSGGATAAVGK